MDSPHAKECLLSTKDRVLAYYRPFAQVVNDDLLATRLNEDLNHSFHDEEDVLADLARHQDLLIELIDNDFEVETDLLDDAIVDCREVIDAFVAGQEKVSHGVLVVSRDAL